MSLLSHKNSKAFLLFLWFIIIISVPILFPDSIGNSDYNGVWIGFSAIMCLLLSFDYKIVVISIIGFVLLLPFSKDILHPLLDSLLMLSILSSVKIALNSTITRKNVKIIILVTATLVSVNVVISFIPIFSVMGGMAHRVLSVYSGLRMYLQVMYPWLESYVGKHRNICLQRNGKSYISI